MLGAFPISKKPSTQLGNLSFEVGIFLSKPLQFVHNPVNLPTQLHNGKRGLTVTVIEVDGKCAPTATEAELAKRRGRRQSKHERACPCGCQRHRGQAKRQARGSKKRLDCAGMRWRQDKAEAVLHLRCIELNHDWDKFVRWFQGKTQRRLTKTKRHKILTDQPLTLAEAA